MQMVIFSLLSLLSFTIWQQPKPEAAFCDEFRQIVAGLQDNFHALKGSTMGTRTNFWNSTLTLSSTYSNYIYTQYSEQSQALNNTYYAIISDEKTPAIQNVAIDKLASLIDGCGLTGYTKTVKSTGISQFSDDPALEKNAPKKITWTHASNQSSITLSAYYDVPAQKDRVAVMFKAPYNASAVPSASPGSRATSKFTVINSSAEAVEGYWLDFTGKEVYYFTLQPKEKTLMDSYTGHVWRFKSAKTKVVVATAVVKGSVESFEVR